MELILLEKEHFLDHIRSNLSIWPGFLGSCQWFVGWIACACGTCPRTVEPSIVSHSYHSVGEHRPRDLRLGEPLRSSHRSRKNDDSFYCGDWVFSVRVVGSLLGRDKLYWWQTTQHSSFYLILLAGISWLYILFGISHVHVYFPINLYECVVCWWNLKWFAAIISSFGPGHWKWRYKQQQKHYWSQDPLNSPIKVFTRGIFLLFVHNHGYLWDSLFGAELFTSGQKTTCQTKTN